MPVPNVTKEDIFLAILAMDTYHRGVNAGLGTQNDVGLGFATGTQIGTATIADYENLDKPDDGSDGIGFVAFRYSWDADGDGQNENVYAYRGTDRGFTDFSSTGDVLNGYVLAAGLPAVLTGQVYVAEMVHKENGARAPVAAVLWASVSEETDKRLSENPGQRPRLRPDEWKGGDQLWIIDLAGEPAAVAGSLKHLAATQFKDKHLKMLMSDAETGAARVTTLAEMLKDAVVIEPVASRRAGGPQ